MTEDFSSETTEATWNFWKKKLSIQNPESLPIQIPSENIVQERQGNEDILR